MAFKGRAVTYSMTAQRRSNKALRSGLSRPELLERSKESDTAAGRDAAMSISSGSFDFQNIDGEEEEDISLHS